MNDSGEFQDMGTNYSCNFSHHVVGVPRCRRRSMDAVAVFVSSSQVEQRTGFC